MTSLLSLPQYSGGVLTKRNLLICGLLSLSVLFIVLISLSDVFNDIAVIPLMVSNQKQEKYTYKSSGSKYLKDGLIDANIFFLHFPKAGTTFAHTVLHTQTNCQHLIGNSTDAAICCIHSTLQKCNESYNFNIIDRDCCKSISGLHKPLKKDMSFKVTVIRDPYSRIESAYFHRYNYYNPDKGNSEMKEYNEMRFTYLNPAYNQTKSNLDMSIALYASSYANSNCYTKMLLGHYCNSPFPIGSQEAAEAKQRLESFDFIAITERWAESICLYHKVLKIKKPIDWSFQGVNTRPGNYSHSDSRNSLLTNYVYHNMRSDVELYATAMRVFESYLKSFPECREKKADT